MTLSRTIKQKGLYRLFRRFPGGVEGGELIRCRSHKEAMKAARKLYGRKAEAVFLGE